MGTCSKTWKQKGPVIIVEYVAAVLHIAGKNAQFNLILNCCSLRLLIIAIIYLGSAQPPDLGLDVQHLISRCILIFCIK
jgi:hypothetical protein